MQFLHNLLRKRKMDEMCSVLFLFFVFERDLPTDLYGQNCLNVHYIKMVPSCTGYSEKWFKCAVFERDLPPDQYGQNSPNCALYQNVSQVHCLFEKWFKCAVASRVYLQVLHKSLGKRKNERNVQCSSGTCQQIYTDKTVLNVRYIKIYPRCTACLKNGSNVQ